MALIGDEPYLRSMSLWPDRVASFEKYPFHLPAVKGLRTPLKFHPNVTFLVGENGSGKSTLMEALAVASSLNPEGGSRNMQFGTRDSHSVLHEALKVERGLRQPSDSYFLRAESFFNVATEMERLEIEYGGKSLHEQSHGESFLTLATERLHGMGLYLLDEPEAALSPSRQLSFLVILDDLVSRKSQFVIATHSPILMAYPKAWIYVLSEDGITRQNYEETENYRVTRRFLENPQRMMKDLLS